MTMPTNPQGAQRRECNDRDVAALKACCKAIDRCTSDRMKRATVAFLLDRYVKNPTPGNRETKE